MTTGMPNMRDVIGLALLAVCVPAWLAAQNGAFIVRLGNDTIFVERYARTGDRLEGDQIARTARVTTLRHFTAILDHRGNVASYELAGRPATSPDAPPEVLHVTFDADTAVVELTIGDSGRTERLQLPGGATPYVSQSYALLEVVTRQARASVGDAYVAPLLSLRSLTPVAAKVTRTSSDSLAVVIGEGGPIRVRVDSAGNILGASGFGTTEQVTVDRVPSVDIRALAAAFANRPLGAPSPRDTARATIAGATLLVDYGRPSRRGRLIFGNLVPWNQVWRTGANAATQFATSADLVMGGRTIPAGTYSLWTLPSPTGWKLIFNKQTGQWGTEYDPAQDLVRLDLQVEKLAQAVERFTIAIEPQGTGGVLNLEWENTRAWIPFAKK